MKPFNIESVTVDPPVLLAPMEDVTNVAFRSLIKRIASPGLMFTEFVSSMALHYHARKTWKKMRIHDDERPLGIQIFGGDPDIMAETARFCAEMGADLVDINMGCWVPKVCKTGSGAALLKDPDLAERIVRAVVKAVDLPVTVKVRAGWTYELFAAPDLARRFQDAGAKMLTLHARFAKQGFQGKADWELIGQLREAVSIPLIGNGDVIEPDDAVRMFRETGCDGVMVGRAAISNPWRLRQIIDVVQGREPSTPPTLQERVDVAIEHLHLVIEHELAEAGLEKEETGTSRDPQDIELRSVRALRGQLPLYIKHFPGAAVVRGKLVQTDTVAEVESLLREFASRQQTSPA
jgi:tRNA-dihydrouridine synthase B